MNEMKKINIKAFLDNEGKVKQIPVPNRTKIPVLAYLAEKFDAERNYTEKGVNEVITRWHTFNDYFIVRRLLVDYGFLGRTPDGAKYWVIQKEDDKGELDG